MQYTKIPEIDSLAGIQCYSTSFRGTRGIIKKNLSDFCVREILEPSFLQSPNFSNVKDNSHKFPLYVLEKQNIDSNHAILKIQKKYNLKLKIIGIKDAKAITFQYATSEKIKNISQIDLSNIKLSLKGFTKFPISKKMLLGNRFNIIINNINSSDISEFLKEVKNIANFYGLQRFGSERLVTHLVGKALIKNRYELAIDYLLSYTTKYDSKFSKEIREKSKDPNNYKYIIKYIPNGMDLEKKIITTLLEGKNHIHAIRSIPINIRRIFVNAYQSFIFNKCLSEAIISGEDISECKNGDLCFEFKQPMTFGKIKKFEKSIDNPSNFTPAMFLVGYSYQPGKRRFDTICNKILKSEGISKKDFYLKELQELSLQGGFRQTLLCCNNFVFLNHKKNNKINDIINIKFNLPKGSYATILLRELIKPKNPIKAGF
ncbi:MAG: tRNA pseudouridine(13) synthase TruD [Nitrososphaeraceae archaeon]